MVSPLMIFTKMEKKYGTMNAEVTNLSTEAVENKQKEMVYRAILRLDHDYIEYENNKLSLTRYGNHSRNKD